MVKRRIAPKQSKKGKKRSLPICVEKKAAFFLQKRLYITIM
ncbi:hypothetical protein B4119_0618 [Parageobacillus caldoxylosilyticus]|uniref:Uncharacterized protein n=1 Tax=Saccharococcus caldoxylosilyticus TaxID=81408 RepID=A0A150L3D4_9BACL|nr:hypothetical protein B4119_0618 [Parageobacillus caldoxylosilyticus]